MVAIPAVADPFYVGLMACGPVPDLAALLDRPAWHADAACTEHPELSWFPKRGESVVAEKAICARCLCRRDCLAFAMQHRDLDGLWAGTSSRSRQRARNVGLDLDEILEALDTRVGVPIRS